MARTSLQEVQSVQDPLQTWNFDVVLPTIPGTSNSREFTFKCISAQIPGSELEKVELEAHGIKLNFAGRRRFTGTWEVTVFETRSGSTRAMLMNWHELARSWASNSGNYKSVYGVTGDVLVYDDLPEIVQTIRMFGLWPSLISEPTLDQTADIIKYQVTFSFDYTTDEAA